MIANKNRYKIFFTFLFAASVSCVSCDNSQDRRREENFHHDGTEDTDPLTDDSSNDEGSGDTESAAPSDETPSSDDSGQDTASETVVNDTESEMEVEDIDVEDLVRTTIESSSHSLASIAGFLGYGWVAGCCGWEGLSTHLVEIEGGWELQTTNDCCDDGGGYLDDNRLEIGYKNFQVVYDDIEFDWDNKTESELTPVIATEALYKNLSPEEGEAQAQLEIRDVESVALSSSHSFSNAKKYGLSVTHKVNTKFFAAGTEHSLTVNWEQTLTDTTTNGQSTTSSQWVRQTWKAKIPVPAKKKVRIYAIGYRVKTTVPYTAKIKFINEIYLDGFMRWGGGENGETRNFHVDYEGSGDRPDVLESWGSTNDLVSFHQHIKDQSYNWLEGWNEGFFNWKRANDHYEGALIDWVDYLYARMSEIESTEIRGNLVFEKSYRFLIVIDDYYDLDAVIESKEGSAYTETPTGENTLDIIPTGEEPQDSK